MKAIQDLRADPRRHSLDDVTVVIRAAGERTADLCLQLVRDQLPADQVTLIRERPFARALEVGIVIAKDAGRPWAVLLDADVLLRSDAMARIRETLVGSPGGFYMINFALLDRTFGGPAFGVHAYNTALFDRALEFIGEARDDQRPETRLYRELGRRGFATRLNSTVVGLHDYEQYHKDLYRKMFVRAMKYEARVPFMRKILGDQYLHDSEARAMMWGLLDGMVHRLEGHRVGLLDVSVYEEHARQALTLAGVEEKPPLPSGTHVPVDGIVESFVPGQDYKANAHWIAPNRTLARVSEPSMGATRRWLLGLSKAMRRR